MKKFHFKLEALLHLRKSRRDTCRQMLAQILNDENHLLDEKKELIKKKEESIISLRSIGNTGVVDVNKISSQRYYVNQLANELLVLDQKAELLTQQIAFCRKTLTKADQEVKVLEKLKEKQKNVFMEMETRVEAREQEEVWLASHLSGGNKL